MISLHVAMLSMMAIGGGVNSLMPDMQRFVVDANHWLTNPEFIAAFTIAQVAPGPNLLVFTLIGLRAAGWAGALGATAAIVIPPALITLGSVRLSRNEALAGFGRIVKGALRPVSVGMMLATGWALARAADSHWQGGLLTLITVAITLRTQLNPLWLITAGALIGIVNGGV